MQTVCIGSYLSSTRISILCWWGFLCLLLNTFALFGSVKLHNAFGWASLCTYIHARDACAQELFPSNVWLAPGSFRDSHTFGGCVVRQYVCWTQLLLVLAERVLFFLLLDAQGGRNARATTADFLYPGIANSDWVVVVLFIRGTGAPGLHK
jgi:hypothetical protein